MRVGLMIVGLKGLEFLKNISFIPDIVVSYRDTNVNDGSHEAIREFCDSKAIFYLDKADLIDELDGVDKVLVVGWQYLIKDNLEKHIVFHDAYLPYSRGFSPTVPALIRGDMELGVTAFQPTEEIDYGKIYIQKWINVDYPLKIKDAFKIIAKKCASMADEIILNFRNDDYYPQKSASTFTVWRDRQDMFIDWKEDSHTIKRTIDALGNPYSGALTTYNNKVIIVSEAEIVENIKFEEKTPSFGYTFKNKHFGKTWELKDGEPVVICGSGLLKITYAMHEETKERVDFKYLRKRFV